MGQRYALWVQLVETAQAEDEREETLVRPCGVVRESPEASLVLRRDQGDPLGLPVALDVLQQAGSRVAVRLGTRIAVGRVGLEPTTR